MSANPPTAAVPAEPETKERKRKRMLLIVAALFLVAGLAWLAWYWFIGQWYEDTDDAYVGANVVQVTPQVAGTVVAVGADDTERVRAGDLLVRLDPADARIALAQAEANLARTVRQVRTLFATSSQFGASVAQRESDLARARADLARRAPLAATGGVSREDVQHARDAVTAAEAALRAAREQLAANRALVDRTDIEDHPDVKAAATRVHEAFINEARTRILAPVSGVVARRTVQVGQRVASGTALMAVVPLENVWVDANFKEGQLRELRLGQPATLESDLYGRHVEYHGRVIGFGAGTGAAFALLPAQNATGNWIKVVQRLAVRIALDPKEVREHPLQVGLSMKVKVDTHDRGGERMPSAASAPTTKQETHVFDTLNAQADARIARIIADNRGPQPRASAAHGQHR